MPNDSKPIVLVADDEPSMVAMLSSHLRSKGYTVLEASDGDQAWELAHEHLPNLVLLDVMMPGMSGWEVCRKIREAVSLAHTGVIMLTGIGENLNEMTSPLYGADAYLDKPFEFSDLDQKISETIARREDGALGRADSDDGDADDDAGLVKKTLRAVTGKKAPKPKPIAEKEPEIPAAKAASKPKKAPEAKPEAKPEVAKNGPKPALAKAVARPAPKLEKPVAKTKVKAKPPVKAPASKPAKIAKPAPKPAKPAAKAAKVAKKSAKPAPKTKPIKKAAPAPKAKPIAKAAKKPAKPAAKSAKKPAKPAAKAAKKPIKGAAKPAKKAAKKR
ncbi:MAG TPA: response regulator [Polyangiaceae bacterium]|jgi:DNA-binding response OmpR family regulator|nr:response regulator [Polyangiaceae bacterium]